MILRTFFVILSAAVAVALTACGNESSNQNTAAQAPSSPTREASPPSVDVAAPSAMLAPAPTAAPTPVAVAPPESAQCLDLVGKGAFAEAVPVCVRAAGLDPENTAVQQALETARAKAVTAGAAAALAKTPAIPDIGKDGAGAFGSKLP
jgi:hypothetical protein